MVKNMRWEGKIYRHPNLQEFISGRYISITGSWVGRRANFRVCEAHSVSPSVQCTRSALCYARSMSRSRFREIWTNLRASGRRYQYAGDSRNFRICERSEGFSDESKTFLRVNAISLFLPSHIFFHHHIPLWAPYYSFCFHMWKISVRFNKCASNINNYCSNKNNKTLVLCFLLFLHQC